MGVDELVTTLSPFHIINNVLRWRSRGKNSARGWRRPADVEDGIVESSAGCDLPSRPFSLQ